MKLKNSKGDKTQILTKFKNLNCDKTQNKKRNQLENSKCDISNCDKIQNSSYDKTKKKLKF